MTTYKPSLSAGEAVITDSIKAELEGWRDAFVKRWEMQPPEFFLRGSAHNQDLYSRDIGRLTNPIHTEWFQQLVQEANIADLDAIECHLSCGEISYTLYLAYRRFFQTELLKAAKKAHDEERPYSEDIPAWFSFKDWKIPFFSEKSTTAKSSGTCNLGSKWKFEDAAEAASLEATMPAGRPLLTAGGAGATIAERDLSWQFDYTALREELRLAREAVRIAEEALDAHLAKKP